MLQQRMMSISLCIAAVMGGLSLTGCSKSSDKTAATETQATSAPADKSSDTIKVGILHSLSGTMAISETSLKDTALMTINEINAKGGVLGKKLEPVVVDPASDWPLFAEKARQLITQDKVAVIFGSWTSVSRKSVLPVVEELNGLLFYPVQYEGQEQSKNIFYTGAAPNRQAIPAVEYLMSEEGGKAQRFVFLGTDYVYPRTTNKILRAFLKSKGVADADIMEEYTPFGHNNYQTIVGNIKKFAAGKKTAVISTINGDSNVPFYRELGNQGIKASDIPVMAFSVGEEELRGIDTKPVGHLAAWNYFMSVKNPKTPTLSINLNSMQWSINCRMPQKWSPMIQWKPPMWGLICGSRQSKKQAQPMWIKSVQPWRARRLQHRLDIP